MMNTSSENSLWQILIDPLTIKNNVSSSIHSAIIDGIFEYVTGISLSLARIDQKLDELHKKVDALADASFHSGMDYLERAYEELNQGNTTEYNQYLVLAEKEFTTAKNTLKAINLILAGESTAMLGVVLDLRNKPDLALKAYEEAYQLYSKAIDQVTMKTNEKAQSTGRFLMRLSVIGIIADQIMASEDARKWWVESFAPAHRMSDMEPVLLARGSSIVEKQQQRSLVMGQRRDQGRCLHCGKPLSLLDKLTGKVDHEGCTIFRDQ